MGIRMEEEIFYNNSTIQTPKVLDPLLVYLVLRSYVGEGSKMLKKKRRMKRKKMMKLMIYSRMEMRTTAKTKRRSMTPRMKKQKVTIMTMRKLMKRVMTLLMKKKMI